MIRLIIISILFFPTISFGQYQYNFMKEIFFGRQPSARAEAMGRSFSSIDGDMTCMFFNPAGTATIKGFEINGSFASPFYLAKDAKYNFINLGYKIKDYLVIGFSRNNYKLGEMVYLLNNNGNVIGSYDSPYTSNYSFTLSSQPIKNLLLGLNANYLVWQPGVDKPAKSIYFDFGAIKKFQFSTKATSDHSISIGASIANLNYAKITLEYYGNKIENNLPVITRYSANYQFTLDKHFLIDTLKTITFLVQGEYQKVLNSQYESAIRTGGEVVILELLTIRAGYYKEKEYDYGFSNVNKNEISSFTYGIGIQLPLYKLTHIPLNVNLDYTTLPQPNYSRSYPVKGNFTTYNLRLSWIIKDKK